MPVPSQGHYSIMKHLDIQKILSDSQHWLRARRSCETQLLGTDHITCKGVMVFCFVCLVLCILCCQFLCIVHFLFPRWYSLSLFIRNTTRWWTRPWRLCIWKTNRTSFLCGKLMYNTHNIYLSNTIYKL
jgi:hypothetical protein